MADEVVKVYTSRENETVAMQKNLSEFPAPVRDLISKGEIIWVYVDGAGKVVAEDNWGDSHAC